MSELPPYSRMRPPGGARGYGARGFPGGRGAVQDSLHAQVRVEFVSTSAGLPPVAVYSLPPGSSASEPGSGNRSRSLHLTYGSVFGTVVQPCVRFLSDSGPAVVETYHAVGMPISRLKNGLIRSFWQGVTRSR